MFLAESSARPHRRMPIAYELIRTSALTVHLLAGALAGAGPLLAAGARLSPRLRVAADRPLRRLVLASLAAQVLSLLIGAAAAVALGWEPGSAFRVAAMRVPAGAYAMLACEWCITLALLGLYYRSWARLSGRPVLHGAIALFAATNLLYHFPTMMVVIGALAEEPTLAAEAEVTRPVFRRLILSPALLGKTLHYWAVSVLVAGVAAVWASCSAAEPGAAGGPGDTPSQRPPGGPPLSCTGAAVALAGLCLTAASGVAAVTLLRPGAQQSLLGGSAIESAAFAGVLAATLWLAHTLLAIATGRADAAVHRRAAWLTAGATWLMVFASR
ncbi:MAG: hypothetical protein AAF790_04225 [Planctomycetota bacterium]